MLNVALIYVVALTKWYDLSDENFNNNNGVNGHEGDGDGGGVCVHFLFPHACYKPDIFDSSLSSFSTGIIFRTGTTQREVR
jgi:hypothetical protein